jgi:hypothetical protein
MPNAGMPADSDEVAHRFRFEAARDSDLISPIIPR